MTSSTVTSRPVPASARDVSFMGGVIACLPTLLGYVSIGFASGAIGALGGFSLFEISALSLFLYAGSAQFLIYALHGAGAGVLAMVLGVLLINMRYMLICSYMARHFRDAGPWWKFVGSALLTDETFGVAAAHAARTGRLPNAWLLGLNLTAWLCWWLSNLAGALLATQLPETLVKGLGFSLVSMFIGLLLMIWFAAREKVLETVTIIVAVVIVALTSPVLDANVAILAGTMVAATLGTLLLRRRERGTRA